MSRKINRSLNKLNLILSLGLIASGGAPISLAGWAAVGWTNEVGLKGATFQNSNSPFVNNALGQAKLSSQFETKLSDDLKFKSTLLYIADPTNRSKEENNSFDFPELNLKWRASDYVIKIGQDTTTWGVTDGYNPVDLLNARNYFDPIHSRKLGAFSISVNYASDQMEYDLLYIPQAREAVLPGTASRWLPREVYLTQSTAQPIKLLLPTNFQYQYDVRQPTDSALSNNIGFRAQAHLSELELTLYGYDGNAPVPLITPVATMTQIQFVPIQVFQVTSDVTLRVQSFRQKTGGFSFVKSFSSWQMKGVSAWTQPTPNLSVSSSASTSPQPGWSHESVMAFEKTWTPSPQTNLITVLQYSNIRRAASAGNDLSSLNRFFDSNIMFGGNLMWRDSDTYTFFFSYDMLKYSQLGEFSYERKLTESMKASVGMTLLEGPSDSPFGVYAQNKSISLGLGYVF